MSAVLVLRHDTGRKVSVSAEDLRWWSVDVSNVRFGSSRETYRPGDFPFVRKTGNASSCTRVTVLEGLPEPEGSRGGWGEDEARAALARLAKADEKSCSCAVATCPACHYQDMVSSLRRQLKDDEDSLAFYRSEWEKTQSEGRDGWSELVATAEGILENTRIRLKWAERDLREAREDRG